MKTDNGIKIAKYLCLIPGFFLVISGMLLLFLPQAASALYDLHDIQTLQTPIALAMGIRQLAIGLMIITLVVTNQDKALAYIMLIGAIVPLTDFFVFCPTIGTISALRHAAPVPLIFGLGIYLMYRSKSISRSVNANN